MSADGDAKAGGEEDGGGGDDGSSADTSDPEFDTREWGDAEVLASVATLTAEARSAEGDDARRAMCARLLAKLSRRHACARAWVEGIMEELLARGLATPDSDAPPAFADAYLAAELAPGACARARVVRMRV